MHVSLFIQQLRLELMNRLTHYGMSSVQATLIIEHAIDSAVYNVHIQEQLQQLREVHSG